VAERKQCEFFLIRYVPDAVRNEFVNIGVLLREAGASSGGLGVAQGMSQGPLLRFTRDWARVRCVDPDVDTEMLEALEGELRGRLVEQVRDGVRPVMELIEDSFSNTLQITEGKGCLAESIPAEIENLMKVYVDVRKRQGVSRKSGRAAIQAVMRTQFERARVWDLMTKRIAAARYTQPGDTLRVDCAYRPNGVIRMFHAVSLENEFDVAKVLAFSMPALREGIARVEGATLQFTALVEPLAQVDGGDADRGQEYQFAVRTMEAQQIRVMTTSDLPRLAEVAREELGVG
jgi:hypothetical protein